MKTLIIYIVLLFTTIYCAQVYSIDGRGNNKKHPKWGAARTPLGRLFGYGYPGDGSGVSTDYGRPECCNLTAQMTPQTLIENPTTQGLNQLFLSFGQFAATHDIAETENGNTEFITESCFGPTGRKVFIPGTNPRKHENVVTTFIDLSTVYGSDEKITNLLRAKKDGLMIEENGMPPQRCRDRGIDIPDQDNFLGLDENEFLCTGDTRGSINTLLSVFQVLFLRNHNRHARILKKKHPKWSDEKIFQKARALNIAEAQAITYYEYFRAFVGDSYFKKKKLGKYKGYNPKLQPVVFAEFNEAINRIPHGQTANFVQRFDANENAVNENLLLDQPGFVISYGIDGYIQAMGNIAADKVGLTFPSNLGFLITLDCQRGRDFGLVDYKTVREKIGKPIKSFENITTDQTKLAFLRNNYQIDNIDLWAGVLAEDHSEGSAYGVVSQYIAEKQFLRLRDGDRLWFESKYNKMLTAAEKKRIRKTKLSHIVLKNTNIQCIQEDLMYTASRSKLICKKEKKKK